MALVTGTPLGTVSAQSSIYTDEAPAIFFQDYTNGYYEWNPDGDGFYYGLSGTASYPVYQLECYADFSLGFDKASNPVDCDNLGQINLIEKLNRVDLNLTLKTMFPLDYLQIILNNQIPATSTTNSVTKAGIGNINNNQFWRVWMPLVYDTVAADFVGIMLHKARFAGTQTIAMPYGEQGSIGGVQISAFADDSLPTAQRFMTWVRRDPSDIA